MSGYSHLSFVLILVLLSRPHPFVTFTRARKDDEATAPATSVLDEESRPAPPTGEALPGSCDEATQSAIDNEASPSEITTSSMVNHTLCINHAVKTLFTQYDRFLSINPKTDREFPEGDFSPWFAMVDQAGEDQGFIALPTRPDNAYKIGEWQILRSLVDNKLTSRGIVKIQKSTGQMIFKGKGKGRSTASAVVYLHYWLHPPLHPLGRNFWHPCPLNKECNQSIQSSLPHLSLHQPLYINVSFRQNGLLNLLLRRKGDQFSYACPSSMVPTNRWVDIENKQSR